MTNKLHHIALCAMFPLAACSNDGPCLEGGDDGECIGGGTETGVEINECAPSPYFEAGTSYTCQGEGTGWLTTDVNGVGKLNPITSCLAYEGGVVPDAPVPEDCATISLDLIPFVPTPTACCEDDVEPEDIELICLNDCGYAACKSAIASIRDAADNLVAPKGLSIPQGILDTTRTDLYAYADLLEAPESLAYCAGEVLKSAGQVTSIGLGPGVTGIAEIGHIKHAELSLSCGLDPEEPYVSTGVECDEPINMPATMAEQDSEGTIDNATLTLTGPGVNEVLAINAVTVMAHEAINTDMSVDFTLTAFDAVVPNAAAGSFVLHDASISLAGPASGKLEDQLVRFAPGTLRFRVEAAVSVDGQSLFGGYPVASEYSNSSAVMAVRTIDGTFHFVDATFSVGEYTATLDTQPSVLVTLQ